MRMTVLTRLLSMKRWQQGLLAVTTSVLFAEAGVCTMAWLKFGHVPSHYLLTGLVISTMVTTVVLGVVDYVLRAVADRHLQQQLQLQNIIFETTPLGVLTLDTRLRINRANPVLRQWLGSTAQQLTEHCFGNRLHPDDRDVTLAELHRLNRRNRPGSEAEHVILHDKRMLRFDGSAFWVDLALSSLTNPQKEPDGVLAIVSDVTQRKAAEHAINQLAYYDPLTGLPNRRLMADRLKHARASSHHSQQFGAVVFIDLDHFKTINDTQGHDAGDALLQQVAARLSACLLPKDTLARQGGDEFILVLENLGQSLDVAARQAQTRSEAMLMALSHPYQLGASVYRSSASLGLTLFCGNTEPDDELLKRADIAMYQAKATGRNTLRFFEPEMQQVIVHQAALEADLHHALAQQQFECYFQVQARHDLDIIGAEVLLRWNHPEHGLIQPETFIPMAEQIGLIVPIGQWVLEAACTQLNLWSGSPTTSRLQLAINVSPRQFHQIDFVAQVMATLVRHHVNPSRLKLELTESLVLHDMADTVAKMQCLRDAGVCFAMDDFGTGYSSLAYLTQLPLEQLKIDKSFVQSIGFARGNAVIVQTIISMGHNLGLEVIAEGVETETQRAFLEANGCAVFQGYLVGKPVTLTAFEAQILNSRSQPST